MEENILGVPPAADANDTPPSPSVSRRKFLGLAATTVATAVMAACAPSAPATAPAAKDAGAAKTGEQAKAPNVSTGGGELLFLTWNNFVPEMDKKLDELCAKWGTDNKVKVTVEHIGINDIPTRRAAAITAKAGPDIIFDVQNWPLLFADSLVDVSDIVKNLNTKLNGFHETFKAYVASGETWKGVPNAWGISAFIYRTDYAKQANVSVPKTWDEFMTFAAALKKAGKPVGQTLGHSFGDPPSFWYPWLWAHGGKEVAEDGKTVAINSPETLMAVEKAVELFKNGLAEGVLAWDDNSNNRAFLAEEIGCTLNGNSIYFRLSADAPKNEAFKKILDNVDHFVTPSGPKGRYNWLSPYSLGIPTYSKNVQAAKDLIVWLMQPEQYTQFLATGKGYLAGPAKAFDDDPVWKSDAKLKPFQEAVTGGFARWPGFPGPLTANSFRVYNNYTIIDLFAKACAGEYKPKAAIEWAEGQLKGIYK